MEPIPVPEEAKATRPYCDVVDVGPPRGVSDDDCGTAQMLIQRVGTGPIPGFPHGRQQYAYFRPSEEELEQLNRGAFIEMGQYGTVVQPFSLAVWPVPGDVAPPAISRAELLAAIEVRRGDEEFMSRVRETIERSRPVLDAIERAGD